MPRPELLLQLLVIDYAVDYAVIRSFILITQSSQPPECSIYVVIDNILSIYLRVLELGRSGKSLACGQSTDKEACWKRAIE